MTSTQERTGSAGRRIWATPTGVRAVAVAKLKGRELFGELFEDDVGWTDRHYYNAIERKPGSFRMPVSSPSAKRRTLRRSSRNAASCASGTVRRK